MSAQYPESARTLQKAAQTLCQPLAIGPRSMPNRMVFGEHLTNFGKKNQFSARHLGYYAERARGGVGLLVGEALCVHPQDWPYEHALFGWNDAITPSLNALRAQIHEANPNTLLLAQLGHTGCQQSGKMLRQSPWGPSSWQDPASRTMSRALLVDEIKSVIEAYANTAKRVMAAKWDGIEINVAQLSLLRQFLSPLTNQRQDAYGGCLTNRMRPLLAVLGAVVPMLGSKGVLGIKLCGDELAPWGGLHAKDCQEIAQQLAALSPSQGRPHYLSIQVGGPYSVQTSDALMPTPQGFAIPLAHGIRNAIQEAIPVFADGRIEQPKVAACALTQHQADAVVMTRALISEPRLPQQLARIKQGAKPPTSIRPHVGMGRYFAVRGDWNRPLSDLANPRAGREALEPFCHFKPTGAPPTLDHGGHHKTAQKAPKTALVIGGGPAGMEAARVLAHHGFGVELWESTQQLGGVARLLAQALPERAEYGAWVAWCTHELECLRVEVCLNTPAEKQSDAALQQADVVVVAIGAQSNTAKATALVDAKPHALLSPRHLLQSKEMARLQTLAPQSITIVDAEMGWHMASATECALTQGLKVTLVSEDFSIGRKVVENADFAWLERVAKSGVTFHVRHKAQRWQKGRLLCHDRFSGEELWIESAISPVVCLPEIPPLAEVQHFLKRCPHALVVGDCRAPRLMGEAIFDAHSRVLHWLHP